MAQNLVVNFIGNNKLSKTTAVVSNDLKKLSKVAETTGKTISKALGAVGLGMGLAALTTGLKNATKAASEDRKSQGLLALALKNTVGATSEAIAGAENYIKKTQLQTAVLDDELRPALATAVRATGSLAGGQRILDIALDVSAETGKDLGSVTGALSKAFNGQTGALKKLVPGLKLTGDVIGTVETAFQGAAENAANLDPYKRLEVIFSEIQETVGVALLPALDEFSAYLASPEGQQNLEQIVGLFVAMGEAVTNVTRFLIDNMNAVRAIIATLVVLRAGWALSTFFVKLYTMATGGAVAATKLLKTALITTGIGAVIVGLGFLIEGWIGATEAQEEYNDVSIPDFEIPNQIIPRQDFSPGYGPRGEPYAELGFATFADYLAAKKEELIRKQAAAAKAIRDALDKEVNKMKSVAEKFRDSIGLAFGTFGKDEFSVFNVDMVIEKMKRVVDAAKGFAGNLAKLRKGGADQSVIDELTAMGPAQGNIVAKGLLSSGKLSTYLGLRKSLYGTGAQAGAQAVISGDATYEININKAVISASDIIKEIQALEKKTGRRYLVATS